MLFFWVNFCVWYEIRVKALFLLLLKWSEVNSVSRVRLFATPWTVAGQAPLSMGFSRQEYWSGLPFPSPGDLPNPGTEPWSPAWQADALSSEPPGNSSSTSFKIFYIQLFQHCFPKNFSLIIKLPLHLCQKSNSHTWVHFWIPCFVPLIDMHP